jgi:hypothetical protein
MQAKFRPSGPLMAAYLAAAAAAYLALTASKCRQTTEIVPFVAETADKCLDKIDNDEDGKIDCDDSDCSIVCAVTVTIDALPARVPTDTLEIRGQQHNATTVTVSSLSPFGTAGTPVVSGESWSARLTNLSQKTTYTITVIGSNGNRRDTATATFIRAD